MNPRTSERGIVLVQVAVAMVALCGFLTIVVDFGVLMTARTQTQAAADAIALAGATALAFDTAYTPDTPAPSNLPVNSALAIAGLQKVWGQPVDPAAVSISMPAAATQQCRPADTSIVPPDEAIGSCVIVDVDIPSPPSFFGKVLKLTNPALRARAIGAVVPGNRSRCVWPMAIPDRWYDQNKFPVGPYAHFDPDAPNTWGAPDPNGLLGSGYSLNFGSLASADPEKGHLSLTQTNLDAEWDKAKNSTLITNPQTITRNEFVAIDGLGGLESCDGVEISIDQDLHVDSSMQTPGAAFSHLQTAAANRFGLDSGATWNTATKRLDKSCSVTGSCPAGALSPRLVLLPLFKVTDYELKRRQYMIDHDLSKLTLHIVNFVGFYINDVSGPAIVGDMGTYPGEAATFGHQMSLESAFLRAPVLYR